MWARPIQVIVAIAILPSDQSSAAKIGCSPIAACRLTASNEDLFGVTYADGEDYCLAY
jgi:hypothetical protein